MRKVGESVGLAKMSCSAASTQRGRIFRPSERVKTTSGYVSGFGCRRAVPNCCARVHSQPSPHVTSQHALTLSERLGETLVGRLGPLWGQMDGWCGSGQCSQRVGAAGMGRWPPVSISQALCHTAYQLAAPAIAATPS